MNRLCDAMLLPRLSIAACLAIATLVAAAARGEDQTSARVEREERGIRGWRVSISRGLLDAERQETEQALKLLEQQRAEIERVVPAAGWLREHGRDPAMARAVEFIRSRSGNPQPFLLKWPGVTKPGSLCDALVSQVDLMATLGTASCCDLPADAAVDSHDLVPWLMGKAVSPARTTLVHHTNPGRYAIRHGHWLLVDGKIGYTAPPAAGGTAAPAAGGG